MLNRHKIRETAVQLLYSFQLEGITQPQQSDYDAFWSILLERESDKLLQERTNAIEHLTQDREDKLAVFEERLNAALAALSKDSSSTGQLMDLLQDIRTREHAWTARQHSLFSISKATGDDKEGEWPMALQEFFDSNAALYEVRKQLLALEDSFPAFRYVTSPLMASARKMQQIGERIQAVARPLDFPANHDIRHLRKAEKEMDTLRKDTTALARDLYDHLSLLDDTIAHTVDNYVPERISAVDRAVLRLGTYELLCKKLPLPIVISEAVEVACRFSGSDSAKFINGVLDKVGKSAPQA